MIAGAFSSDYISPLLKSLHWLSVEAKVNFKILLITYKILDRKSTEYVADMWTQLPELFFFFQMWRILFCDFTHFLVRTIDMFW